MKPSSCSALTKLVMLDLNRCFWDVTLDEQSFGEEADSAEDGRRKMALAEGASVVLDFGIEIDGAYGLPA
jgi:hypothetical protein